MSHDLAACTWSKAADPVQTASPVTVEVRSSDGNQRDLEGALVVPSAGEYRLFLLLFIIVHHKSEVDLLAFFFIRWIFV